MKNTPLDKDSAWILRILNAARPGEKGRPISSYLRPFATKRDLEWLRKPYAAESRLVELRSVLEPIAKYMNELPDVWKIQDERAYRILRRKRLRMAVPLERRFVWTPLEQRDDTVEKLMRAKDYHLRLAKDGFKALGRLSRNKSREERHQVLKRLQRKGAPIVTVGTVAAFRLGIVNGLIEWANLQLEYSELGELTVKRIPMHAVPDRQHDSQKRRQTVAAIEGFISMTVRGVVHQCPICRWWFVGRPGSIYGDHRCQKYAENSRISLEDRSAPSAPS